MLDKAGFEDVHIVLSSGLDELTIFQILTQITDEAPRYGADTDRVIRRLLYGVGTKMATSTGVHISMACTSWSPSSTGTNGDRRSRFRIRRPRS